MRKYIKPIIISAQYAFLLLIISPALKAQENKVLSTPAAYESYKLGSLWQQSTNAAGSLIDNPVQFSELNAGYKLVNGSFHRPQEEAKGSSIFIDTEGSIKLKKAYVWGRFNYSRDERKDVTYNSSIIDPFRGMPYYVADSLPANWSNQRYDLQFRVATPKLRNVLSLGLEGSYKAYLGAKQRDPRTENYFYTLELKPGIVYSPNDKHNIGLNFKYASLKEESEMSQENRNVDPVYYELYGLGTAVKGLGSGRTTNYVGNEIGGGLQYNYRGAINLLFGANYSAKVEDVEISFSTPRDDSSTKDQIWNTNLTIYTNGKEYTHYLKLDYQDRSIDGIQYITKYDNTEGWQSLYKSVRSTYKTKTAKALYTLMANRDEEYNWRVDAGVNYEKKNDTYILPYSVKNTENIAFSLGGKKNFALSDKRTKRLLIGAGIAYNKNLSGEYNYNGQHSDYSVVKYFEQTDLNYLISDYYTVNSSAVYSQRYNETTNATVFAKVNFSYSKTSDFDFSNRTRAEFSIGLNF